MILRLSILFISALLAVACSSSSSSEPSPSGEVSIAHLKSLCTGGSYRITHDYTLRGVVVATDWLGELNKSAIVVDNTGGVEVAIDLRNISERLPIYSEVTIHCNGLMLSRIGGKIELGLPPTGDFPLDNIDEELFERHIHIVGRSDDFTVETKLFSEIGIDDISNLVRFENVRICDEEQGLSWCEVVDDEPITTIRTLVNREGERFAVRLLSTCRYALSTMPQKEISVIGVIEYSDNRYYLRIVNQSFI